MFDLKEQILFLKLRPVCRDLDSTFILNYSEKDSEIEFAEHHLIRHRKLFALGWWNVVHFLASRCPLVQLASECILLDRQSGFALCLSRGSILAMWLTLSQRSE